MDDNKDIDMLLEEEVASTKTDHQDKTDEEHYANLFNRPEGLYLQGVDNMSTDDIKDYCGKTALIKVEWVNDTSCVLVYETAEDAQAAAQELLVEYEPLNSTELRRAKTYRRPNDNKEDGTSSTFVPALSTFDELKLRMATDNDIKTRGARHQSRYYLFHGAPQRPGDNRSRQKNQGDDDNNGEKKSTTGSILDRLGSRVPPMRRNNYDNNNNNNDKESSRYDRRRREDSDQDRRRSMSPPPRQDTDKPIEIPDHLRGRLGNLK